MENSHAIKFQNVKVYGITQPGIIRNLVVETRRPSLETMYTKAVEHQLVRGTLLTCSVDLCTILFCTSPIHRLSLVIRFVYIETRPTLQGWLVPGSSCC